MHRLFNKAAALILCFAMILSVCGSINAFAADDTLTISYTCNDGVYGNNFFADNMPKFNLTISGTPGVYKMTYKAYDEDSAVIASGSESVTVTEGTGATKTVSINEKRFGVFNVEITVSGTAGSGSCEIPYTVSNHTKDMPNNKRIGVSTHIHRGRGGLDEHLSLLKSAGIGNLRGEDLNWQSVEKTAGSYELSQSQKDLLNGLKANDIDYLFLLSGGNPLYNGNSEISWDAPSTAEGYEALTNYTRELLNLAGGKIKYIEVWNEYHDKNMSGTFYNNAEVHANLHRAVYKGVSEYNKGVSADKGVKVFGIAENWWGIGVSDAVQRCLAQLNGEKAFDYVSTHPYSSDFGSAMDSDEESSKKLPEAIKRELKKYGYDENIPKVYTELGIPDNKVDYNDKVKASRTLRNQAYIWSNDMAEIVYNYNFCDYDYNRTYAAGEKDATKKNKFLTEASFGLVKGYEESDYTPVPYLGKSVYVALAYWNGLMAEGESKGTVNLGADGSYCYRFKDRLGRDVLMYGMKDESKTSSVYVDLKNAGNVKVADMYGNETDMATDGGVLKIKLSGEPNYVIGSFDGVSVAENYIPSSSNKAEQIGSHRVRLSGVLGNKSGRYSIMVYAPSKTSADIDTSSDAHNTDVIAYVGEGTTDTDGRYSTEFDLYGVSGAYNVNVYSKTLNQKITSAAVLHFASEESFALAASEANALAASGKKEEFCSYINKNKVNFGFNDDEIVSVDKDGAYSVLYNDVKAEPFDTKDIAAANKRYTRAVLISNLNNSCTENLFDYYDCFKNEVENIENYKDMDEETAKSVTKRVSVKSISDTEDFVTELTAAICLEKFTNPDGVNDVRKALKDFKQYLEIDESNYSNDVISAVMGTDYESIDKLKSALDKSADDENIDDDTSGGSHSSGGGGGYGSGISIPQDKEENKPEEISYDIYIDLDDVIWARNAIVTLTDKGILNGKEALKFCPNDNVLREEFAKMAVLTFVPEAEEAEIAFKDVAEDEWYTTFIKKAKGAGIINGYSDELFGTGDKITREDLCVMAYAAYKYGKNIEDIDTISFKDADEISDYARAAVAYLAQMGVVNGMDGKNFVPKAYATRAEAAKIIYMLQNIR